MSKKPRASLDPKLPRWYRGADVPMALIRRFAREVAEHFHPDKIILFGSHAYGTPHADSDVDLLVIMPTSDQHSQAVRIRWQLPAPCPWTSSCEPRETSVGGLPRANRFIPGSWRKVKFSMKKATREWVKKAEA